MKPKIIYFLIVAFCFFLQTKKSLAEILPNDKFSSSDVVEFQLNSLQANLKNNRGIYQCWIFAHPENKKYTGPFENFAKMIQSNQDVPIVVSLVGSVPDDFKTMLKEFENCKVEAYELNLSCPHVAQVGLEVGDDHGLVKEIVSTVKKSTNVPVIAKVGLGTSNYLNTVGAAIDSGIDAITAINTVRSMAIDVETQRPILSNKIGGLSGTPIKPVALRCVYEISSKFDIPILGCGGISTWEDAVEFILAGTSAVQFGSVMGDHWDEVFSEINNGIEKFMERKGYATIGEMVGRAKRS